MTAIMAGARCERMLTILGLSSALFAACASGPRPAELVFHGGPVYTVNESAPWAEALAVREGRIVAVGSLSEVDAFIDNATRVVDLDGRLLLPGFIDGHVHLYAGSQSLEHVPLHQAASYQEMLDLVRVRAESSAGDRWVRGIGWRYHVAGEGFPRREDLDAIVSRRPALLLSQDARAAWVSRTALERAGLPVTSGVLRRPEDIAAVERVAARKVRASKLDILRRGIRYAHRFGITSVHVSSSRFGEPRDLYREIEREGEPALGIHFADAEIYAGRLPAGELESIVEKLDRGGESILITASDPDSVRTALDALEKATPSRRHRIVGVERISDADRWRFGRLGVLAGILPWKASPDWMPIAARDERGFPWASLRRAGAKLVLGSDWPLGSLDPLIAIYTAVTRRDLDGRPEAGWIPEERLRVEDAVAGYTLNGAFAAFEEDRKGSLEVGKRADLVALSENILAIPPERIAETKVEMTVVGGHIVYVASSFSIEGSPRVLEPATHSPE